MRWSVLVGLGALTTSGCDSPICGEALHASPGSDTAVALAVATDTVTKLWGGTDADAKGPIAESYRQQAGDTVVVRLGPRCWRGTDAPGATVWIVPPHRVVTVWEQMGG